MGKPLFTQVSTRQNDKQDTSKNPANSAAKTSAMRIIQAKREK